MQLSDKGEMCTRSDGTHSRKKLCRLLFSPFQLSADTTPIRNGSIRVENVFRLLFTRATHYQKRRPSPLPPPLALRLTLTVPIDSDERQMNGKKEKFPCLPSSTTKFPIPISGPNEYICVSNYVEPRRKFLSSTLIVDRLHFEWWWWIRVCCASVRAAKIQSIDQKRSMLMRRPIKDE